MRKLFIAFFLFVSSVSFSQDEVVSLTWMTLKYVDFEMVWDNDLEAHRMFPTFGERVKEQEGKQVEISGYIIPYSLDEGTFVLSAKPNSDCYFCGGAGPESVLSLKFKDNGGTFTVDDYIKVKGKFRLNSNDVYDLYYILDDAEIVE
jgi:hypothetical protein